MTITIVSACKRRRWRATHCQDCLEPIKPMELHQVVTLEREGLRVQWPSHLGCAALWRSSYACGLLASDRLRAGWVRDFHAHSGVVPFILCMGRGVDLPAAQETLRRAGLLREGEP